MIKTRIMMFPIVVICVILLQFLAFGQTFREAAGETHKALVFNGFFLSVALSPDGQTLASGGFGIEAVDLWDVPTQSKVDKIGFLDYYIPYIAFLPDGRLLI